MTEQNDGMVEEDRDHISYSPALGSQVQPEPTEEPEPEDDEVELVTAPGFRGVFVDPETGLRFRRGRPVAVGESDAERLLSLRRRGVPVVVRADS